jgi:hypothetical protein
MARATVGPRAFRSCAEAETMYNILYIIGAIVVIYVVLKAIGIIA